MRKDCPDNLTIKKHISPGEIIKRMGMRQILPFLVLPLFLFFLIFMNFKMTYEIIADNIRYNGEFEVRKYSLAFEDYLSGGVSTMEYITYNIEHMFKDDASNAEILEFIVEETAEYTEDYDSETTGIYGFVRGEYMDGVGWIPDEGYVPTERPWYIDAVKAEGKMTYVAPYVDEMTGDTIMTIAVLLSDKESVVAVDIKMNKLQQITDSLLTKEDEGSFVIVLDEDGAVVAHTLPEQVGRNYLEEDEQPGHDIAKELLVNGNDRFDVDWNGGNEYVFSRELSGGWYVLTVTNESQTFSRIFKAIRESIIVAIAGLVIIFGVLIHLTLRRIESEDYNSNLKTVAGIYVCMYKMNLISDTFEEISCRSDDLAEVIGGKRTEAADTLRNLVNALTDDRSQAEMREFTDAATLADRMKDRNVLTIEFMNHKDMWCRGRFLAAERDEDGNLVSVIWTIEYIDKEKRDRDRLLYLSETDRMTGINNRGCGEGKIRKALMRDECGMFMLLDVDKFKAINDNYGHDVGDRVLIAVADCMKHSFRGNDIVMRLGGDEFAAYTPLVYSREGGGGIIVDRFLERLRAIHIDEMGDTPVEVSIGVAFYKPEDHFSFDELYKRADKCTYESKEHKGVYVTYYAEGNGEYEDVM